MYKHTDDLKLKCSYKHLQGLGFVVFPNLFYLLLHMDDIHAGAQDLLTKSSV